MGDKRRAGPGDERQVAFTWSDPEEVLRNAEERGGSVLFEAPDTSRIVTTKPPRLPRIRTRSAGPPPPESFGLPFGMRVKDGRITCWSCGEEMDEGQAVSVGPGLVNCPGCGSRLPFA